MNADVGALVNSLGHRVNVDKRLDAVNQAHSRADAINQTHNRAGVDDNVSVDGLVNNNREEEDDRQKSLFFNVQIKRL